MTPKKIFAFFSALKAKNPDPKGELHYTNPYTLLVAVALSAQSTDLAVNKITQTLFQEISTPEEMMALGLDGLRARIKTLGLYNMKAKHIIETARLLIETHNSKVPQTREALEALPGVGRKTANVVLNIAFGEPTIAVDTHLFRVCNRTGLSPGKTPLQVEKGLEKAIPKIFIQHAHHWLILHGRYICKARKPLCDQCPVYDLCEYEEKSRDS